MEALSEYDFYMDTHRLRISVGNMENANTREKLEAIRVSVLSNLSKLPPAPSAPLAPRPPSNFRVRPAARPLTLTMQFLSHAWQEKCDMHFELTCNYTLIVGPNHLKKGYMSKHLKIQG